MSTSLHEAPAAPSAGSTVVCRLRRLALPNLNVHTSLREVAQSYSVRELYLSFNDVVAAHLHQRRRNCVDGWTSEALLIPAFQIQEPDSSGMPSATVMWTMGSGCCTAGWLRATGSPRPRGQRHSRCRGHPPPSSHESSFGIRGIFLERVPGYLCLEPDPDHREQR